MANCLMIMGVGRKSADRLANTLCVILHYGSYRDTLECIDSLAGENSLDVVVVDNDPAQTFPAPTAQSRPYAILQTGGEMGFAEANNFGVRSAKEPHHLFVLVLNNDTVCQPGSIRILLKTLEDPTVGIVGPSMPYFNSPDRLWANGGKVSRLFVTIDGIREPQGSDVRDVDYLPGAAFLTRMDIWERVGGLPERYFLAFEEAQFALETKKLGLRSVVNQGAVILHKVGMSSDRQPMYFYNTVRNRMRFGGYLFGSHFGPLWGALSGLARSISSTRLRLWFRAVKDEITGVPLNRETLHNVKRDFRNKASV